MRVVIAEDSGLLRQMLAALLVEHGCEVVGQAVSKPELLRLIDAAPPDVAVLDIRLPPDQCDEGLQAAEEIRRSHPGVGLLVLSQYAETAYAVRLLKTASHSVGYLVKDRVQDAAGLLDAINRVARGEVVIDPIVVGRLIDRRRVDDPLAALTPSERKVLELMAVGRSNAAIAEQYACSVKTVEKRITAISYKLGLPPPDDAARAAVNVRVLAVLTYLRGTGQRPAAAAADVTAGP
jgi:DNA-binding NarL/FixJ family response regulator